jgi:Tfp pilus assembly PilM family ATPase
MHYLGIDIGSEYLKYSLLDKRKGQLDIIKSGYFKITDTPLSLNSQKRHLSVRAALQKTIIEIENYYKKAELVLSLSGFMSQVRVLDLPDTSKKYLKKVLDYEAIQIIPDNPEIDFIYCSALLESRHKGRTKGLVAISRANDISAYIDTLLDLGFNLIRIILEPIAYRNAAQKMYLSSGSISCITDIGFKSTTTLILKGEEILDIRMLPVGIGQIQKLLARKLKIKADEAKKIFDEWFEKEVKESTVETPLVDLDLDDDIDLPDFDTLESEGVTDTDDFIPFDDIEETSQTTEKDPDTQLTSITITNGIKNIFSEIERSLSKVKNDHGLFKNKFELFLTGSVTSKNRFIAIADEAANVSKIKNFDLSNIFTGDIEAGDINTCSHALALSAVNDKTPGINLIPESYAGKLNSSILLLQYLCCFCLFRH